MSTQDPSQRPNLGEETSPWNPPGTPEQQPGGAGQQSVPPGTGPAPPPGGGYPAPPPGGGYPAASEGQPMSSPPPGGQPTSQPPGGQAGQPTGADPMPPPGYGTPAAPPPAYSGTPAPGYAPAPVGYGIQGKMRGPWAVWLLGIITLGIYFLVWYYKINNEARQYDPRIEVEPGLSVLAMFPGSWIIVPPLISFYNAGKRIGQEQRAAGLPVTCNAWIGLILYVFVLGTGQIYYQYEINKVLDRYPGAEWGQQVPLYF